MLQKSLHIFVLFHAVVTCYFCLQMSVFDALHSCRSFIFRKIKAPSKSLLTFNTLAQEFSLKF